jgi:hypothetical protein
VSGCGRYVVGAFTLLGCYAGQRKLRKCTGEVVLGYYLFINIYAVFIYTIFALKFKIWEFLRRIVW